MARGVHLGFVMKMLVGLTSLTVLSLCLLPARDAAAQAEDPGPPPPASMTAPPAPPGRVAPTYSPAQTLSCTGCYQLSAPRGYYNAYPQRPLTEDEWRLVGDGEISAFRHVSGVLLALSPGFGLGQLAQGRWLDRGWIFTAGEAASLAMLYHGASPRDLCDTPAQELRSGTAHLSAPDPCRGDNNSDWMIAVGVGSYVALRVWEVIDSISGPTDHNNRVRALRRRAGFNTGEVGLAPFIAPSRDGGAMAGLSARF